MKIKIFFIVMLVFAAVMAFTFCNISVGDACIRQETMLDIFQRQPSKSFPVVQRLPKLTLPQPPIPATKVSLEPRLLVLMYGV